MPSHRLPTSKLKSTPVLSRKRLSMSRSLCAVEIALDPRESSAGKLAVPRFKLDAKIAATDECSGNAGAARPSEWIKDEIAFS